MDTRPAFPGVLIFALFALSAHAQTYQDDIGAAALADLLGADTPTGGGVPVLHVEAESPADSAMWQPDTSLVQFGGKTFSLVPVPGLPSAGPSGHATGVGSHFYGSGSIAPGIGDIEMYLADHWLGAGFLNFDAAGQPLLSAARVGNHSYVGSDDGGNEGELLRRLDWSIAEDEAIQVVGVNNGGVNRPLLADAFNAIAVGRTDGNHARGSLSIDPPGAGPYVAGRTRPDLVAPLATTSNAAPVVAAAASLLVESGAAGGLSLSSGSTVNRNGDLIYNAERAAAVKAALMAGADRRTVNQSTAANITDYRQAPEHRSDNGLDRRYGAGQLNVLNSHALIAAGEQDSLEDDPGAGTILWQGFDYDDAFGGLNGSNATAGYAFTAEAGRDWLSASLVWNVAVDGGVVDAFDGTAELFDFDLELWSDNGTAGGGDDFLAAVSAGLLDNTENLWLALTAGHGYELRVVLGDGQAPVDWSYALAWQIGPAPVPLPAPFWLLAAGLVALARYLSR